MANESYEYIVGEDDDPKLVAPAVPEVEVEGGDPPEKPDPAKPELDELEIDVEDDTPPEDRGRKPGPPVEDPTDDELKQYSKSVQERIRELTRSKHDARREKERLERQFAEAAQAAKALLEENRALKGQVGKGQHVLLETGKRTAQLEYDQAKKEYREAYETGDADKVLAAQEQLTKAALQLQTVSRIRPPTLQESEVEVQRQPQQPAPPPPDPKFEAWKAKNRWFGGSSADDVRMTTVALGEHNVLVKFEGVDPTSDEYYERIGQRMRELFPGKFQDSQQPPQPAARRAPVAPVSRTTAPRRITLTESQVRTARELGLTPQQYAKEVLNLAASEE